MNGRKQFTTANQARFGVATPKGLHSQGSPCTPKSRNSQGDAVLLENISRTASPIYTQAEQHRQYIQQNSVAHVYISAEKHRPGSGDRWEWRPVTPSTMCHRFVIKVGPTCTSIINVYLQVARIWKWLSRCLALAWHPFQSIFSCLLRTNKDFNERFCRELWCNYLLISRIFFDKKRNRRLQQHTCKLHNDSHRNAQTKTHSCIWRTG